MSLCLPPARPQALGVRDSPALLAPAPGLSGRNKLLQVWQQGDLGARRPLRKGTQAHRTQRLIPPQALTVSGRVTPSLGQPQTGGNRWAAAAAYSP